MTAPAQWDILDSPVGPIGVGLDRSGRLLRVWFTGGRTPPALDDVRPSAAACAGIIGQLRDYFAGKRRNFDIEIAPRGSEFERRVWSEVARIPYGETRSYGEVARLVGGGAVARAVGRANGANPIPIVIPCHRVVGANGSLVGYGGGLATKAALLRLEGASVPSLQQLRLDL